MFGVRFRRSAFARMFTASPAHGRTTQEAWEFATGDVVRCREQRFAAGESGLVAYEKSPHNPKLPNNELGDRERVP